MKKIIKSICITPEIWEMLKEEAKKRRRSISGLIEDLILKEKEK